MRSPTPSCSPISTRPRPGRSRRAAIRTSSASWAIAAAAAPCGSIRRTIRRSRRALRSTARWSIRKARRRSGRRARRSSRREVKAPVLGLYGEADAGIPVAQVDAMKAALTAAEQDRRDQALSRRPARLPRRLSSELSQGSGRRGLGADDGVVQEVRRAGAMQALSFPSPAKGGSGPVREANRTERLPAATRRPSPASGRGERRAVRAIKTPSPPRSAARCPPSRERRWSPSLTSVSTTSSCASREVSSTA